MLLVVILSIRAWQLLKHLNSSFAKLGFVVREDAKKYFDDAADKLVDTNEQFEQRWQKVVEEGTRAALADKSAVTERTVTSAHAQANDIILKARTDAQQIIQAAHDESAEHAEKTLARTSDAISWVLSQYLEHAYSTAEHEALIETQIKNYIDEHRK